jgi:hypothetical protein
MDMMTSLKTSGTATLILPDGTEIKGACQLSMVERDGTTQGSGTFESDSTLNFDFRGLSAPSTIRFRDGLAVSTIILKCGASTIHFATTGAVHSA